MASVERVRRLRQTGADIALAGAAWGLIRSLLWGRDAALLVIAAGTVALGSVTWIVGMVLERSAKQPDVGRQMRQP